MSKVGVAFFNYVTFSDYGYKHANGIDGSCIRDNTITLPNTCSSGETSYIKSQGLVIVIFTGMLFFPHYAISFLSRYRKIGGDVCTGGVESQYASVETPCCTEGNQIVSKLSGCYNYFYYCLPTNKGKDSYYNAVIGLSVVLSITILLIVSMFIVIIVFVK